MVVARAFLALLAGFAAMGALVAALSWLERRLAPSWSAGGERLTAGYAFVNLAGSFAAAAAGGYVVAWLTPAAPMQHALALAMIVLVLSALTALQSRGKLPVWYLLVLVALTPVGVVAGGIIQLRAAGILS